MTVMDSFRMRRERSFPPAVQDEAARVLADMAKDNVHHVNGNGSVRYLAIEVCDEHGPVMLAKFSFSLDAYGRLSWRLPLLLDRG
jgi:hypothetical protein